jgi:hypothetical protein
MKWFACLLALPFIATAAAAQGSSASPEAAQPAATKTYPTCSATITDSCMQRSASATATHSARHHRHQPRTTHPRRG